MIVFSVIKLDLVSIMIKPIVILGLTAITNNLDFHTVLKLVITPQLAAV